MALTFVWLPRTAPIQSRLTTWAIPSYTVDGGTSTAFIHSRWLGPSPLFDSLCLAGSFIQNIARPQSSCARATCDNKPAPACAPALWSPRPHCAAAFCVRKSSSPADSGAARSAPPPQRPRRDIGCHSCCCLHPFSDLILQRPHDRGIGLQRQRNVGRKAEFLNLLGC